MNWNLFKTNWFSVALVLLVLVAMLRGSGLGALKNCFSTKKIGLHEHISGMQNTTALSLGSGPAQRNLPPLEVDQATAKAFLKRFSTVAVSERKKFGVPASVLLAAAFLNSNAGLNDAAEGANNYFALACSKDWEGETVTLGDQCMRKYESPWASWRDFSIHLSSQEWIGSLRQSAGKDWQKWAKGLNKKDLSPVSSFGQKIGEVIEYYHLYELDLM